jgi:hypothetical protein
MDLIENKPINEIDWDNIDACFYIEKTNFENNEIEIRELYKNIDWKELYKKDGLPVGVL